MVSKPSNRTTESRVRRKRNMKCAECEHEESEHCGCGHHCLHIIQNSEIPANKLIVAKAIATMVGATSFDILTTCDCNGFLKDVDLN